MLSRSGIDYDSLFHSKCHIGWSHFQSYQSYPICENRKVKSNVAIGFVDHHTKFSAEHDYSFTACSEHLVHAKASECIWLPSTHTEEALIISICKIGELNGASFFQADDEGCLLDGFASLGGESAVRGMNKVNGCVPGLDPKLVQPTFELDQDMYEDRMRRSYVRLPE